MNIVIIIVTIIQVVAYIPVVYFYPQINILLDSYLKATSLKFNDILLIMAIADFSILHVIIIRKFEKVGQKMWQRLSVLFPKYKAFLKVEMDIQSINLGTREKPGKGIVFINELKLDPAHFRNTSLSTQDELYILHELAKFHIHHNQNYNSLFIDNLLINSIFMFLVRFRRNLL